MEGMHDILSVEAQGPVCLEKFDAEDVSAERVSIAVVVLVSQSNKRSNIQVIRIWNSHTSKERETNGAAGGQQGQGRGRGRGKTVRPSGIESIPWWDW
jgi:hypothetical protein